MIKLSVKTYSLPFAFFIFLASVASAFSADVSNFNLKSGANGRAPMILLNSGYKMPVLDKRKTGKLNISDNIFMGMPGREAFALSARDTAPSPVCLCICSVVVLSRVRMFCCCFVARPCVLLSVVRPFRRSL